MTSHENRSIGGDLPLPVPHAPPGSARVHADPAHPQVQVGRVISVVVDSLSGNNMIVKLADGRAGVVALADFGDEPVPSIGASFDAALLARDDPKGRVALSRSWAVKQQSWDRVLAALESGEPLTGPVTKIVKGGAIVDLGLRAFLPTSMIAEHDADPEAADPSILIGTDVTVVVTEGNRDADRVVVSRRSALRRERRKQEGAAFAGLEVGQKVTASVVGLVDFGAWVEVNGLRALLHRSEMSWGRSGSSEKVYVGDALEVVIIEVSRSKRRVGVSVRQLEPDPYAGIEVDAVTGAVITRVVDYGAFAQLDDSEVIGLIHMSELSDLPGYRPDELVIPGDPVQVKVLSVDHRKRRVSLSVRQALWT